MTTVDARDDPSSLESSHSVTDVLAGRAADFAAARRSSGQPRARSARPTTGVAVLACMDARLDVHALLGLGEGDAHVLRNAGGVVTDDMIRSLAVSQHELGTTEIILLHHTQCGMISITDDGFRDKLLERTGARPDWPVHAFSDLEENVRLSIARLRSNPFLAATTSVRGFIYDVATGELSEVTL
ncbi:MULTISPECIES: beta-class carbonic anhydrase [Protofrankia]|uniref:carbonic anhydrase n=1 Tax=Candidatus Protofrankia datiscae TaxID=2716812 RepID=F8AY36_9ACTN|nr:MULTISPECIES: carbonic anhydrase [Protofrankia]AEH08538.1 carbonic anhydrase [Candidatus Protofrankia datiscae]